MSSGDDGTASDPTRVVIATLALAMLGTLSVTLSLLHRTGLDADHEAYVFSAGIVCLTCATVLAYTLLLAWWKSLRLRMEMTLGLCVGAMVGPEGWSRAEKCYRAARRWVATGAIGIAVLAAGTALGGSEWALLGVPCVLLTLALVMVQWARVQRLGPFRTAVCKTFAIPFDDAEQVLRALLRADGVVRDFAFSMKDDLGKFTSRSSTMFDHAGRGRMVQLRSRPDGRDTLVIAQPYEGLEEFLVRLDLALLHGEGRGRG